MTLLQTYRGDTAVYSITLVDADGEPLDLTGLDLTWAATRMYHDAPFLVKTVGDGIDIDCGIGSGSGSDDTGICVLTIDPIDTADLTHTERFVWDFRVDNGLAVETPLRGRWVVMLNVDTTAGSGS